MAANVDPVIYPKYLGQYLKDSGARVTITKEGRRLLIESSEWPTGKYELFPVSEMEFFLSFIDFRVQFVTDTDDRVVPAHAKKFAATLQSHAVRQNPILIRIETKAGHGLGKPVTKLIDEQVDIYSFLFKVMGIEYRASK